MRRVSCLLLLILAGPAALAADDKPRRTLRFGKDDLGKLPVGWKAEKTGTGAGSIWKVVADDKAPSNTGLVLMQTAEAPKANFNVCVVDNTDYKDVDVAVAFKSVEGKVDQGGGIVWRYQDPNNYYVARFNPLEDNYRLYKVVEGKRAQLATKEEIKVPAGEWHTLRIKHAGEQIECYLDDKKVLEGKDSTFSKAGKVGLWTKADAQTAFDGLTVSGK